MRTDKAALKDVMKLEVICPFDCGTTERIIIKTLEVNYFNYSLTTSGWITVNGYFVISERIMESFLEYNIFHDSIGIPDMIVL